MFERIKKLYKLGFFTKGMINHFLKKGLINEEQLKEILNQEA